MNVTLRPATVDDASMLRRWDEDPHAVDWRGEDDWYDWDVELARDVPWREILVAHVDGVPVGVVVLIDAVEEETHFWGDDVEPRAWSIDVWIGEPQQRSRGIGTQMMQQALRRCFVDHGASVVLIDPLSANRAAIRFYERLGFSAVEQRRFGRDDTLVMAIRPDPN